MALADVLRNATVSIGGVDRTLDVVPRTLSVKDVLGHRLDRCSFHLRGDEPARWDTVRVEVEGTAAFTGYVMQAKRRHTVGAVWEVEAVDEGILLDRKIVTASYEQMYDGDIVKAILSDAGLALDTSAVENVTWITRVRFNRRTVRDAIQRLADLSGAAWYVHDGALHYWNGQGYAAPFGLSETPDEVSTFAAESLDGNWDATGVVNMVEVVGATYMSDPTTMYLPGTGEDTRVSLYFRVRPAEGETAIQVWRNDGDDTTPSWTPLTVKAGYIDALTGPDEVLYYYQEKALEAQNPWPNLRKAVKVYGRFEIPLRMRLRNESSIAHYGQVLQGVIIDNSLASKEDARLAGKRKLAESAFEKTAVHFGINRPGLRTGQVVSINYPSAGVTGDYLIQRATLQVNARGYAVWEVDAGAYDHDLVDLILALHRRDEPAWNDEEVLDELLEASEAAVLAETTAVSSDQAPYKFDAARWDFARFG